MAIGQIVYDLEDFAGSGGLISTTPTNGLNFTTINSATHGNYESERINITNEIFGQFGLGDGKVTKLGIQAPPGTRFCLDGNLDWEIMIGRTGIYEINHTISQLVFIKPIEYKLDVTKTDEYINTGRANMDMARTTFDSEYKTIRLQQESSTDSKSNADFYEKYDELHNAYVTSYEAARAMYVQGLSGVYVDTGAVNHRLKNIIIDFVYTTIEE